jgi:hypothetical protein
MPDTSALTLMMLFAGLSLEEIAKFTGFDVPSLLSGISLAIP